MKGNLSTIVARLAAASDEVRLRLLRLLELHELTVGEVAQVVQLPQSTVSRHLKSLAEAEWLSKRTEGPAAFYRLCVDDQSGECRELWRVIRGQLDPADVEADERRAEAVVAERKTDSQTFFGRIGGEWDAVRAELFGRRFTGTALHALLDPRWCVLDLGCGTGNGAELMSPWVKQVFAVDSSPTMLEAARLRLGDATNVEFIQRPLEKCGLGNASVDVVMCILALHHVESIDLAMREMHRVLRSDKGGGVALIVDMVPHNRDDFQRVMGHLHQGFSAQCITQSAERVGFSRCMYQHLPPEAQAKGPELFVAAARLQ